MRIRIDKELCIGCEACIDICPEVLEMQDDFATVKIEDDIPEELEEAVREAAEACPSEAIEIEEDE
jgi:ferredoxin